MKRVILSIWTLLILLLPSQGQDYYKLRKHTRISTGLNEAAAIPYEDGVVYITQSTSVGASSPTNENGDKLFTIFFVGESGQKKHFREELVSQKHEGPVSFSGNGKLMVFCQQRSSAGAREDPLGLYFAEMNEAGAWVNERAFEYNAPDAWLFSPSLSEDGRTLYFSANFVDGHGGFDIYRSKFKGGAWTKPENLGPSVNTGQNELYPFIHPVGRLYFSTEGHDNGRGGYDIFRTAYVEGKWAEAIKLDAPINSRSNDYHIWFSENFKEGYLTSDHRSSSKEIYEISTDIPEFESPEPIKKTIYTYLLRDRKLMNQEIDTSLFSYYWMINDTLKLPGHEVRCKFPEPGIYECKLMVYDIQLDTLVVQNTIPLPIRLNEQAVITCPDTIMAGTPVEFDASQTYLPGFDDYAYLWEFEPGSFGQGKQLNYTYLYPGRYRITLGVQERQKNRKHIPEIRSNFKDVIVVRPGQ